MKHSCKTGTTAAAAAVFVLAVVLTQSALADISSRVVYGTDNRRDEYDLSGAMAGKTDIGKATAALIQTSQMSYSNGVYTIKTTRTLQQDGVCGTERFSKQIVPAFCSGFLIHSNLVATAGHCIQTSESCSSTYIVFGFKMTSESEAVKTFESSQVFRCTSFKKVLDGYVDFAVVTLDKVVNGITPLTLNASPPSLFDAVYVIGHPSGLPRKYADGANVYATYDAQDNPDLRWFFISNLDTFGGNSGSAVLNSDNEVSGILVRGATDYRYNSTLKCKVVNVCQGFSSPNCGGEQVTVSEAIVPYVPLTCTGDLVCKNGGSCLSGACKCAAGFYGNDCSFECGRDKCYDHGECVGLWKCNCDAGYGGDLCYTTGAAFGARPAMIALSVLSIAVLILLSF